MTSPVLTRPLTCFDVESTGVNPLTARIVQIAILRVHPSGVIDRYQTLVNPGEPIPSDATEVHGISDDMVKDAPSFKQLAPRLIKAFQNADFCGFNIARFDLPLIREEFRRAGISTEVSANDTPPCILDAYILWTKQETRTLSDAVRRFLKRDHTGAHDALADVEATLEVVKAQLTEWSDLPRTVRELHQVQFPKNPNAIDSEEKFVWKAVDDGDLEPHFNFGKYVGEPLRGSDPGFLRWMLRGTFAEDTKQIARDALAGRYPVKEAA